MQAGRAAGGAGRGVALPAVGPGSDPPPADPRPEPDHRQRPDARVGHAPAQHARKFLRGYRVHTLICRACGLPLLFFLAPANRRDAPFAKPLLAYATRLFQTRPRTIRLDTGYRSLLRTLQTEIVILRGMCGKAYPCA